MRSLALLFSDYSTRTVGEQARASRLPSPLAFLAF